MKKRVMNIVKKFYPLLAVALFFAVWWIAAAVVGADIILPSPWRALKEFFVLMGSSCFYISIGLTLLITFVSFLVSFALAAIASSLARLFPPLNKVFSPLVLIARATPTMSIILLAIIWLNPWLSPVFIALLITFPLLYASFYGALTRIDSDIINMCKVYALPIKERLKSVYIPAVLPEVFTSSKSSISLSLKVLIAAEVMAQTAKSMGDSMQLSRLYFNTAELMGWTIAAILLSLLLELGVQALRKLVIKWER
jgi:NitT/TauT family transport system permease protein